MNKKVAICVGINALELLGFAWVAYINVKYPCQSNSCESLFTVLFNVANFILLIAGGIIVIIGIIKFIKRRRKGLLLVGCFLVASALFWTYMASLTTQNPPPISDNSSRPMPF